MPVILGKELFHAMVVDLDYPGSRIRFHDRRDLPLRRPRASRSNCSPAEDGHKDLLLSMEGGEPVVVGLDTGQGGALHVFGHYAQAARLPDGTTALREPGAAAWAAPPSPRRARCRSVTLAGYELQDVPVTIHQDDVKGAFDTKRQAGNLGAGILTASACSSTTSTTPSGSSRDPSSTRRLPRDRTGLAFERDGRRSCVVRFVAPGSPAAAAGWQEGERVTALDGEAVGPDWWRVVARWARAADGTTATLTLADGSVRTLGLKAFY